MIYQVVIKSSHNHPVFLGKQVDKSQFLTANQDNYSNKILLFPKFILIYSTLFIKDAHQIF